MKIVKEFKDFINKGNVLDVAIAFIMGVQFNAVVTSFTDAVLMQAIGAVFGGKPNFNEYTWTVNGTAIYYGTFLTAVINFVVIAFALFLVVKAANKARTLAARGKMTEEEAEKTELDLLAEIRDALVQSRN